MGEQKISQEFRLENIDKQEIISLKKLSKMS